MIYAGTSREVASGLGPEEWVRLMLSGGVLYVKAGGRVTGRLDLKKALEAAGFAFGPGENDEVQVTLGDETEGIATNASVRLIVDGSAAGTAIAGSERTGESANEETLRGPATE